MKKLLVATSLFILFVVTLFSSYLYADIITLKDGEEVRGVILKELRDSIVVKMIDDKGNSSVERSYSRDMIKTVLYSEQEQYYFQLGNKLRSSGKTAEASAAYQKALDIRPDFKQAKAALFSLRLHRWKERDEMLRSRISMLNKIYKQAETGQKQAPAISSNVYKEEKIYLECGFFLEDVSGMIKILNVRDDSPAQKAGMQEKDILVSVGGQKVEGQSYTEILNYFLRGMPEVRLSLYRTISVTTNANPFWRYLPTPYYYWGFSTSLEYQGLSVKTIKPATGAETSGLHQDDIIVSVNSVPVQFVPTMKVTRMIMKHKGKLYLGIERYVSFWKKLNNE